MLKSTVFKACGILVVTNAFCGPSLCEVGPSFTHTNLKQRSQHDKRADKKPKTLDSMYLISGSGHPELASKVSDLLGVTPGNVDISRFADGEITLRMHDDVRGKDVYIVQTCALPVNENIMELLLTISCARRAGARRICAVIPYYGYKHQRRISPISTKHQSRFLTSGAMDFAKMLQEMGVDAVVSVDIQRPGQGQEACFFDGKVPLETIVTSNNFVNYFADATKVDLQKPIVVVSLNSESLKKAFIFQLGLQKVFGSKRVKLSAFFQKGVGSGLDRNVDSFELIGSTAAIDGADVIIVDDIVDSAQTITQISDKLTNLGAHSVFACASHGLFTGDAAEKIAKSSLKRVVVTDSLPLPANAGDKIVQLSVAPMISKVILAEHFRTKLDDSTERHELDD